MIKQFYFFQFNLAWVNKVKWFQVLLCISNNSIKRQSSIYTRLNAQTVLFISSQFGISHSFAYSLIVNPFYLTNREDPVIEDLRVMAKKGVLCIPQSSSITRDSSSYCLVSHLAHLRGEVWPLCRDAVGVFFSHCQLGWYSSERGKEWVVLCISATCWFLKEKGWIRERERGGGEEKTRTSFISNRMRYDKKRIMDKF